MLLDAAGSGSPLQSRSFKNETKIQLKKLPRNYPSKTTKKGRQ